MHLELPTELMRPLFLMSLLSLAAIRERERERFEESGEAVVRRL
jgi:hypothetical protein